MVDSPIHFWGRLVKSPSSRKPASISLVVLGWFAGGSTPPFGVSSLVAARLLQAGAAAGAATTDTTVDRYASTMGGSSGKFILSYPVKSEAWNCRSSPGGQERKDRPSRKLMGCR